VVLTRCRVGHSRLARGYLLNNGERLECVPCGSGCSLEHVLLDCVDVRQTFYSINSLYDLFTRVAVLKSFGEIDLYAKM